MLSLLMPETATFRMMELKINSQYKQTPQK